MAKCIDIEIGGNPGIICVCKTDFNCPKCGYPYHEKDYHRQLYNSPKGLIYKTCKGCKTKIGITSDIRGDIKTWLKEEE